MVFLCFLFCWTFLVCFVFPLVSLRGLCPLGVPGAPKFLAVRRCALCGVAHRRDRRADFTDRRGILLALEPKSLRSGSSMFGAHLPTRGCQKGALSKSSQCTRTPDERIYDLQSSQGPGMRGFVSCPRSNQNQRKNQNNKKTMKHPPKNKQQTKHLRGNLKKQSVKVFVPPGSRNLWFLLDLLKT